MNAIQSLLMMGHGLAGALKEQVTRANAMEAKAVSGWTGGDVPIELPERLQIRHNLWIARAAVARLGRRLSSDQEVDGKVALRIAVSSKSLERKH